MDKTSVPADIGMPMSLLVFLFLKKSFDIIVGVGQAAINVSLHVFPEFLQNTML